MEPLNNPVIRQTPAPGFGRTLAWLNNVMVAVCDFTNGPAKDYDTPHSHEHEQITFVAEGELLFMLGNDSVHLKKGDIITIPSGVSHCIRTLTKHVTLVDSFSPVRADFLEK